MIAALYQASEESGTAVTAPEVRDQFVTLMAAGAETVAARVHAEAGQVLSAASAFPGDASRLGFTGRLITETLRLCPPVWMVTRKTTADAELAGRQLPRGTVIVISSYPLHHNPGLFSDPEAFDPDRWLPERSPELPRGAFNAFGAGPRKCIGDVFGMTEAAVTIATVVCQWQLTLAPRASLRPATGTPVMRPARPLINLSPRDC